MPPQTIHLAPPLTWYDGGTWLSCEPYTISFSGLGRWKRYLGHSSLKRKFSHSSAVTLRYLRANARRAFRCLLLKSGSFFRLKSFHPLLNIYLHTVAADPGRSLFFSCLLIFLVELPLLYFAFSIIFLAVLSRTVGRPLLGLSEKSWELDHFATQLLLFCNILAHFSHRYSRWS